jgi:8-amino-7-oxononanoate synthase
MSLFDKLQQITAARQTLADRGITSNVVMEKVLSSTEAVINGRRMILAGTNNYMGLTFDPDCIEAAKQAADKLGTGTTGSRMANGTYSGHVQLERELADFFGCSYGVFYRLHRQSGDAGFFDRPGRCFDDRCRQSRQHL